MKWHESIFEFKGFGVKGSLRAVVPDVLPEFLVTLPGENRAPVEVSPGDFLVVDSAGNVTVERKQKPKKPIVEEIKDVDKETTKENGETEESPDKETAEKEVAVKSKKTGNGKGGTNAGKDNEEKGRKVLSEDTGGHEGKVNDEEESGSPGKTT